MTLTGDWQKFARHISTLDQRIDASVVAETGKIAKAFEKFWVTGIKQKSFGLLPNTPKTAEAKGSTTPLINHGDLVNSIRAQRMQEKVWFTGIHKSAKRRSESGSYQNALISVAEIMEYGTKGPIKPKGHPYLSIPVTKKASRAGSPRKYPGDLIPFFPEGHQFGILVDSFSRSGRGKDSRGSVQFILVRSMPKIKARPSMRIAYSRFQPIAEKMWAEAVRREVYRDVA